MTTKSALNPNCRIIDLLAEAGVASIAINATATIYTKSFKLEKGASYAFEYQFASEGSVAVGIELEQGNQPPPTEGSADLAFVVPEDAAAFDASVVDELNHVKAYAPAATGFARLKMVGAGGNAATTVLSKMKVSVIVTV